MCIRDRPSTTGQVIGSYYENAQVCLESASAKLTCDSASAAVRTAADGSYTLDGQGAVLVTVGTDAIRHEVVGDAGTKVTQKLLLRAPAGHSAFVSALSTELAQVMDGNGGDFTAASGKLAARIGVSEAGLASDFNKASGDELAKLKEENASAKLTCDSASAAVRTAAELSLIHI